MNKCSSTTKTDKDYKSNWDNLVILLKNSSNKLENKNKWFKN
jgi:hypothetical protein